MIAEGSVEVVEGRCEEGGCGWKGLASLSGCGNLLVGFFVLMCGFGAESD